MKKLAASAASVAVAISGLAAIATSASATPAGAAAAVPAATSAAASAGAAAPGYTPPKLTWQACDNPRLTKAGIECAMLTVPLDYADPKGRKIKLAVSRLKHTKSAGAFQGVMLVNPGGPGGSGLNLSILGTGTYIPGKADLTYDWIGFDPRGVGDSTPALTCDSSFTGYDRPSYEPTSPAVSRTWLNLSENYATDCKYAAGRRLLDHVKTTDSVNDMESLRKALGQKKINFYGFSYGTYLGSVYATLHPDRVRRFVFDGTVNPTQSQIWYEANLDQDLAFEKTIKVYFGWLAKYDSVYHLGTTAKAVEAGFYRERALLDKTPAGGVIGPDELTDVLLSAGYYVYGWEDIGAAYSALVNGGDFSGVKELFDDANPQDTPSADNGLAMYLATQCTDAPWPRSWSKINADNKRVYKKARFETWGNARFNGPCQFWPAEASTPVKVSGADVSSKILMIGETLDAATPFSGSLVVRDLFPSARLIEGVGGTTHAGSLSGVSCTDNAIGHYLANGTVPKRKSGDRSDKKCPPVPQPDPTATVAPGPARSKLHSAFTDALPAVLRKALVSAQQH